MSAPAAAARRRPLPVAAVAGIGLLGVAAVMLLLFGPFHGARYEPPGRALQRWLANLSGDVADLTGLRAADRLTWMLLDGVAPLLTAVLVLVMAVLPAAAALLRRSRETHVRKADAPDGASHAGARRRSAPRPDRRRALIFLDDGSLGEVGAAPGSTLELRIGELRALATEAGLPWLSRYETEGGARGFLEILRALQDGPAQVRRAETGPSAEAEPVMEPEPLEPEPLEPEPLEPATETAPRASWTAGSIGAVYTPTTLYSSGQDTGTSSEGPADADGEWEPER